MTVIWDDGDGFTDAASGSVCAMASSRFPWESSGVGDLSNGTERGNTGPRFVAIIFWCALAGLHCPASSDTHLSFGEPEGIERRLADWDGYGCFCGKLRGNYVSRDAGLAREFEERLADCPALAFRVALGVLRNRAEAEDVAQDALVRAYRNFHRLRERERFRAWLVRDGLAVGAGSHSGARTTGALRGGCGGIIRDCGGSGARRLRTLRRRANSSAG